MLTETESYRVRALLKYSAYMNHPLNRIKVLWLYVILLSGVRCIWSESVRFECEAGRAFRGKGDPPSIPVQNQEDETCFATNMQIATVNAPSAGKAYPRISVLSKFKQVGF